MTHSLHGLTMMRRDGQMKTPGQTTWRLLKSGLLLLPLQPKQALHQALFMKCQEPCLLRLTSSSQFHQRSRAGLLLEQHQAGLLPQSQRTGGLQQGWTMMSGNQCPRHAHMSCAIRPIGFAPTLSSSSWCHTGMPTCLTMISGKYCTGILDSKCSPRWMTTGGSLAG